VQHLGGEIPADQAPVGAVRRGVDVAGAEGEQDPWLEDLRAVDEGHAALDKDTVGEVAVGDEDEWAE
jgi:hypothetical protein